jgi:uncharacterized membrane protein (Fun14 family)
MPVLSYSKRELFAVVILLLAMIAAGLYAIGMVTYNKEALVRLAERKEHHIRVSESNNALLKEILDILKKP